MKKDLENKIVELEGKLSQLSNQLGKKENDPYLTPSDMKKNPRSNTPEDRHSLLDGFISESDASVRISDTRSSPKFRIEDYEDSYLKRLEDYNKKTNDRLIESLDPDGSAKRQLLAIAEENHRKGLAKKTGGGALPKGFDGEPKSPFSLIISYDKKYAKFLFKSKRCLGCKKQLDKQHVILCHECANDRLSELEFKQAIRYFTRWGLYKKPFLTKIALKLKLAKVVTEQKHEK